MEPWMYIMVAACLAAMIVGYITRWILEESGIDIEEKLRDLFNRR